MKAKSYNFLFLAFALIYLPVKIFGQAGYAINFQNETFNSHGDFIYCGQPNYSFTNKMTVTAWIKWTTDPGAWAVANHNSSGSEREGYYSNYISYEKHNIFSISNEKGQFWLRNAKLGNKVEFTVQNATDIKATASYSSTLTSGTWYFLAGVYDGTNVILYIDGVQQASASLTGNIAANTDCRLDMGRLPWGYGLFVGYLDEVRIWNTALTAAEIVRQKSSATTVQHTYCKSFWNFNAGSGTSIADSTGTANGTFYTALIDVHSTSDFLNKIIRDDDRAFVDGAWNGKTTMVVAGAGVDGTTNSIVSNSLSVAGKWNKFTFTNAFSTTPIVDNNDNMTWFGVLDGTETTQWVTSDAPLPVELVSFTSLIIGNEVKLDWQTATEVNNYGFEIQRSSNQKDWIKIGFVQGHGNSNSPKSYSLTDIPLGGTSFKYRLKQIDFDGGFEYSEEIKVNLVKPNNFNVGQNFPNPFNPTTMIKFELPQNSFITIKIFDVLGREVKELINAEMVAGYHEVKLNASDLSSGIYFYKIQSGKFSQIKKMILLK